MNQSLIKRERVNERFEGRTGGARTPRPIHLSLNLAVEEIGGADLREHVHRSDIDQQRGGVLNSAIMISADIIGHSPLDQLLFLQVECADNSVTSFFGGQNLPDKMRRKKRSFHFGSGAEFARGVLPIRLRSIVPIALCCIERSIIAVGVQGAPGWTLRNNAQRN